MKKILPMSILMTLALILTACGSGTVRNASALDPVTDSAGMTTDYANALPIESQLLVGTFKLEGTAQAVNAKQAGDLVAYWQVLKELSTSGSAAQEEIDATVSAIESAMTPEQLKAIASMQITRQDMFTVLREQGGGFGTGTQNNQSTSSQRQSNGSQGTGNQRNGNGNQRNFNFGPSGGFDGGGGGFPPGGGFGTQQTNSNRSSNNSQSTSGNNFTSTRVPSALLDAVIKLLQEKTQS